ncbi:hypothetical protein BJV82DRAFT_201835 [Fennellomyces sp. T-0311]|nr:hypothetical protein BJV82DRAFT_201835 [Fennellomyces sp. T-0311]
MTSSNPTLTRPWIAVAMAVANALHVMAQGDDSDDFDMGSIDDDENADEELKDEEEEETWSDATADDDDASLEAGPEENEAPAPKIIIGGVDKDTEPPVDYPPEVLDVADTDDQVNDFDEDEMQQDDEAQRQQDDEQLSQELASEEVIGTEDTTSDDPEDITNEQLNQQIADEEFNSNEGLVEIDEDEGLNDQQQEESIDLDQELANEDFEEEEQIVVPEGEDQIVAAEGVEEAATQKDWETNDDPVHLQDQIVHQKGWEESEDGADLSDLSTDGGQINPAQPQGDENGRIPPQYDDKVVDDYDQSIGDSLEKALERDADIPWYDATNAKNEDPDPLRDINLSEEQLTQGQQAGINGGAPASVTAEQSSRQGQLIMIILLFIVLFMLRKRWLKLISRQKNPSTLPFYRNSYSKKSLD